MLKKGIIWRELFLEKVDSRCEANCEASFLNFVLFLLAYRLAVIRTLFLSSDLTSNFVLLAYRLAVIDTLAINNQQKCIFCTV